MWLALATLRLAHTPCTNACISFALAIESDEGLACASGGSHASAEARCVPLLGECGLIVLARVRRREQANASLDRISFSSEVPIDVGAAPKPQSCQTWASTGGSVPVRSPVYYRSKTEQSQLVTCRWSSESSRMGIPI